MKIVNFKKLDNPSVIAKFDINFETMGMTIRSCVMIKSKKGYLFVSMPNRKYEKEGKTEYFAFVVFEKEKKALFDKAVIDLVNPLLEAPKEEPPPEGDEESWLL